MIKDLIIIGAGPGGYELALAASKKNIDTLLIEEAKVGGTCLHHGCIPTKTLYHSAKLLKEANNFSSYGIEGKLSFDFLKAKARVDEVVNNLESGIRFRLSKSEVDVIYGKAKLLSNTEVLVNGDIHKANYIVIATGSTPLTLQGISGKDVVNSNDFLKLTSVPKNLVIIGAGVIGIEFASIFKLFGSNVEVIEAQSDILPFLDKEISKRLLAYLKNLGIKFNLNAKVLGVDGNKVFFETKGEVKDLSFDKLLVAIGRKPNLEGLGLDEAGIKYTNKGIEVNKNFQTNIPNIYAIGDVTGKVMLAHNATYMGYKVLNHILGEDVNIDFNLIPNCIFTFPEVASIGLSEEEAKGVDYKVSKYLFKANGKAHTIGEVDGFIKMISYDEKILGVHILGTNASELIHEAAILMNANLSINEAKNIIFAHPTLSEVISATLLENI